MTKPRQHVPNGWEPYRPGADAPWNRRRVVHLHRRAGFAATWTEIERDLKEGPDAAIQRVLAGQSTATGAPPDFEQTAGALGDGAAAGRSVARMKAWWLYRMLFTPDPLAERLTLMWHNHFATSNLKINDVAAMRRQNEIFRKFARAPFGELISNVLRDPAILVWLDAPANRKEHPNENLARELMELFTLGVGHYSETDVKEVARALTGWTVTTRGEFLNIPDRHDGGEKLILGKTGPWHGDDAVRMLLDHPATCRRLAFRVCELLMAQGTVDDQALAALAEGLRNCQLDVGWAVETVLRSRYFFSEGNIGRRVTGPAEFIVGSVRALEMNDPPPSTLILGEWLASLGQDLFYPPNVFGWPGGRSWITSRSVIGRLKFATALADGATRETAMPLEALAVATRHGQAENLPEVIRFFCELLLGNSDRAVIDQVEATVRRDSAQGSFEERSRRTVATILSMPDVQLG